MTGSADKTGTAPEVEMAGPKQLREFDARLVQQLPDELTKEEMQHLIEHPEELRARLHYFGLKDIDNVGPSHFAHSESINHFSWVSMYADVFVVSADFSRIHLPPSIIYTYTTPVFVAPKLELHLIFEALEKFGVSFRNREIIDSGLRDIGRPSENYISSFSLTVIEDIPRVVRDLERYCSVRMTLREYLLWILHSLYLQKNGFPTRSDLNSIEEHKGSLKFFFGSVLSSPSGESPTVKVQYENDGTIIMTFSTHKLCDPNADYYSSRNPGVRRVKLFKSLPQLI